jgi:hypothetical protein
MEAVKELFWISTQSSWFDSRGNPEELAAGYEEVRSPFVELQWRLLGTSIGLVELWPTQVPETAKGSRPSPRDLDCLGCASASPRLSP